MKARVFIFFSSLFLLMTVPWPIRALAAALQVGNCPDRLVAFENIQIQQSLSGQGDRCYLSIHPRDAFETLTYRDYLLTDDGLLMVFNSYSGTTGPQSDGAREFYFLPRVFKGFAWKLEDEYLVVTGFGSTALKFSLKTSQLIKMDGAETSLAQDVLPTNNGGFEILHAPFIFVDAFFGPVATFGFKKC
jgi:hypothetical protein